MPSRVYASSEITWISNGPVRPSSSRIWLSRLINRSSASAPGPAAVHPAVVAARRAQRRLGVAADEDRGSAWSDAGVIFVFGMS